MLKKFSISVLLLIFCFSCARLPKRVEKTPEISKILELYDNWELEEAQALLDSIPKESRSSELDRLSLLIEERGREKNELKILLIDLKEALYNRDYEKIKGYISESLINTIKLEKIKNIDLTGAGIYFSKIKYYKNSASTVMLINFYEETSYLDLEFQLKEGLWKLVSFGERR